MTKSIFYVLFFFGLARFAQLCADTNSVRRILPITFEFGDIHVIAGSTSEPSLRDAVHAFVTRQSFTVNGKVATSKGEVWCEVLDGETYRDEFLDKKISRDDLRKAHDINQLKAILGEPLLAEGPIDGEGTTVYQWRTLAFEQDGRPIAFEVTAALRPAKAQMLFLWLRSGRQIHPVKPTPKG